MTLNNFINYATLLENFGWVSISSQFIFSKAVFLFSFFYDLFLFLIFVQSSVNICLADNISHLHRHFSEPNPDIFLKYKNFFKLIFSILICIIIALVTLQKILYNFSIFFIIFKQIICSFLLVFSLDQASFYSLKVFYFNISLIIALILFNIYFLLYIQNFILFIFCYFFILLYLLFF